MNIHRALLIVSSLIFGVGVCLWYLAGTMASRISGMTYLYGPLAILFVVVGGSVLAGCIRWWLGVLFFLASCVGIWGLIAGWWYLS